MAQKTDHAPRTLRRAASGEALPKLVLDFAAACGADTAEATKQWQRARARHAQADGRTREALLPEYISTFGELRIAMIELRARVGNPPLRKLEERAGPGKLPRSTVSLVLRGRAPLREELLVAFVQACGARGSGIDAWRNAWKAAAARVSARERRRQPDKRYGGTLFRLVRPPVEADHVVLLSSDYAKLPRPKLWTRDNPTAVEQKRYDLTAEAKETSRAAASTRLLLPR